MYTPSRPSPYKTEARSVVLGWTWIVICMMPSQAWTQASASPVQAAPTALASSPDKSPQPNSTTPKPNGRPALQSKPEWNELTAEQQSALKPLAGKWRELSASQKRKWIELSKNFKTLPADEKSKMHSRMAEWVALSQQERAQARLNYVEAQKVAPEEKAAKWQAYQELSPEEKRKLADKAPPGLPGSAAVKPTPPQRLATVPFTRHTPKDEAQNGASGVVLHQHTLLPQSVSDTGTTAKP